MPDLEQRMRGIDRLPAPDLLDRARAEARSHEHGSGPAPARRVMTIAAAFTVFAAALWLLWVTFHPHPDPVDRPAAPMPLGNGDIWVWVYPTTETHFSSSSSKEAIYRVDPKHEGDFEAMWTDSPAVFNGAQNRPELINPEGIKDYERQDYAFSPDGKRVAFSAQAGRPWNRNHELFVMNADGTGLRQLTHEGGYATSPSWSPDGNTIAYSKSREKFDPTNIYLIDADGGPSTPLAIDPSMNQHDPSWSPDGTRIAFVLIRSGGRGPNVISSMRLDGTDRVEIARGPVWDPAWSPDGASIAYLRKEDKTMRIWVSAPDGSGAHELADTVYGSPVWAPDGSSITFARLSGSGSVEVWLVDPAGGTPPERWIGWPGFDGFPIAWQPVPRDT
jgi:Tol biopolymer transport system component